MKGLILCGGQSTRMGTDKGLIRSKTQTWAQNAADKLAAVSLPVLVSVNSAQYESYRHIFPPVMLVQDDAKLELNGPLLGVLSAHLLFPSEDLLVLACDMPFMELPTLQQLLDRYSGDQTSEAFVFTNNGEPEPLCAIYTTPGLQKIYGALQQGALSKYSMKFALSLLHVQTIPITESQKLDFRNFNTHSALNGL